MKSTENITLVVSDNLFSSDKQMYSVPRATFEELFNEYTRGRYPITQAVIIDKDERVYDFTQTPKSDHVIINIVPSYTGGRNQPGGDMGKAGNIILITALVAFAAVTIATGGLAWVVAAGGIAGMATIGVVGAGATLIAGAYAVNKISGQGGDGLASPGRLTSLRGATNRNNLGGRIPIILGRHLIYPDIAAYPYASVPQGSGQNDMHLLFSVGYQEVDVETPVATTVKFGDTSVSELGLVNGVDYSIHRGVTDQHPQYPDRVLMASPQAPVYWDADDDFSREPINAFFVATAPQKTRYVDIGISFPAGFHGVNGNGDPTSIYSDYLFTLSHPTLGTFPINGLNSAAISLYGGNWESADTSEGVRLIYDDELTYIYPNTTVAGANYIDMTSTNPTCVRPPSMTFVKTPGYNMFYEGETRCAWLNGGGQYFYIYDDIGETWTFVAQAPQWIIDHPNVKRIYFNPLGVANERQAIAVEFHVDTTNADAPISGYATVPGFRLSTEFAPSFNQYRDGLRMVLRIDLGSMEYDLGGFTGTTLFDMLVAEEESGASTGQAVLGFYSGAQYSNNSRARNADMYIEFLNYYQTDSTGTELNNPISAIKDDLTTIALKVPATSNNRIGSDKFNIIAQLRTYDYSGTGTGLAAWTADQPTSNPASAFLYLLINPKINPNATENLSRIDWASLEDWWTFCNSGGNRNDPTTPLECNIVFDSPVTLEEAVSVVCNTGRAMWTVVDGLIKVVVDKPINHITQYFTPKNTSSFSGSKLFIDEVTRLDISYVNPDLWTKDEVSVYRDPGSPSDELVDRFEANGITSYEEALMYGRYVIGTAILRPERFSFTAYADSIVCTIGDRIRVSHDVPLIGSGMPGRILDFDTDISGNVTRIYVDEFMEFVSGETYRLLIRTDDPTHADGGVTNIFSVGVDTPVSLTNGFTAGDSTVYGFDVNTTISGSSIGIGMIYMPGIATQETIDLIIESIAPSDEVTVEITGLPYSEDVFTVEDGVIPAYSGVITVPPSSSGNPNFSNTYSLEQELERFRDNINETHSSPSYGEIVDGITDQGAATELSAPTVAMTSQGRTVSIAIGRPTNVFGASYRYQLQITMDDPSGSPSWYSLNNPGSDPGVVGWQDSWRDTLDEVTEITGNEYTHAKIPFGGDVEGLVPLPRTYYYRVRSVTGYTTVQYSEWTTQSIQVKPLVGVDLDTGTITAEKIEANAVTAEKINAGTLTAETAVVQQLHADEANIGVLTAEEAFISDLAGDNATFDTAFIRRLTGESLAYQTGFIGSLVVNTATAETGFIQTLTSSTSFINSLFAQEITIGTGGFIRSAESSPGVRYWQLNQSGAQIAGWTINATTIAKGTSVIIDSANERITLGDIVLDAPSNTITIGTGASIIATPGSESFTLGDITMNAATNTIQSNSGNLVIDSTTNAELIRLGTEFLAEYDGVGDIASLRIGSGTASVRINTSDGIWAGDEMFSAAPFSVTLGGVIRAASGTIGGFEIIDSATYKQLTSRTVTAGVPSAKGLTVDHIKNRISVFSDTDESVVMGYLNGLPKQSADEVGNWGLADRGFWVLAGDTLVIDGDVEINNGDWKIVHDASYLVLNGTSQAVARLGTGGIYGPGAITPDSGEKGVFINETASGLSYRSKLSASGFFVGNDDKYIAFEDNDLLLKLVTFKVSSLNTDIKGSIRISGYGTIDSLTDPITITTEGTDSAAGTINHASELQFKTNGTTALTIDSSQRVGIGTTPVENSTKLHVNGLIRWGGGTSAPFAWSSIDGGGLYVEQTDDNTGKAGIRFQTRVNNSGTYHHLKLDAVSSSLTYFSPSGTFWVDGHSAVWDEAIPGTTVGAIHLVPGSTDFEGAAITFGAGDTSSGTSAQAGIYTRTDGTFGTDMLFATTDSYAAGSKTALRLFYNKDAAFYGDVIISKNNPWLIIDSPSTGSNTVEQAAGISIGESAGELGNAALHLTYTGDGYAHIGMGVISGSVPANRAMRLHYQSPNVHFDGAITSVGQITINSPSYNTNALIVNGTGNGTNEATGIKLTTDGNTRGYMWVPSWANVNLSVGYGGANDSLHFMSNPTYPLRDIMSFGGYTASTENIGATSGTEGVFIIESAGITSFVLSSTGSTYNKKWLLYNHNNLSLYNITDGLTVMTFTPGGNVGIGTTAPAYKLDVNGTGRFSTYVTSPSILATNAIAIYNSTNPVLSITGNSTSTAPRVNFGVEGTSYGDLRWIFADTALSTEANFNIGGDLTVGIIIGGARQTNYLTWNGIAESTVHSDMSIIWTSLGLSSGIWYACSGGFYGFNSVNSGHRIYPSRIMKSSSTGAFLLYGLGPHNRVELIHVMSSQSRLLYGDISF